MFPLTYKSAETHTMKNRFLSIGAWSAAVSQPIQRWIDWRDLFFNAHQLASHASSLFINFYVVRSFIRHCQWMRAHLPEFTIYSGDRAEMPVGWTGRLLTEILFASFGKGSELGKAGSAPYWMFLLGLWRQIEVVSSSPPRFAGVSGVESLK